MTVDEAYVETMDAVRQLEDSGIRVECVPSKSNNPEMVSKYSGPDRLIPEKWFHITFFAASREQADAVFQAAKELGWRGICFDTGGCSGQRDWEIDWSFHVEDVPDGDQEARRKEVENLIQKAEGPGAGSIWGQPLWD